MEEVIIIPKGCTCKNSFDFPYSQQEVTTLFITYKQNKVVINEKALEDCVFESNGKIAVNLSQEQTLRFEDDVPIKVQIRATLRNGAAIKSNVLEAFTDIVLKEGVI